MFCLFVVLLFWVFLVFWRFFLTFPEFIMKEQTQSLVFSKEPLDQVQMCYLSLIPYLNPLTEAKSVRSGIRVRKESRKKLNWVELMKHYLILQCHLSSVNNIFPIFQHKEGNHSAASEESSTFCNLSSTKQQFIQIELFCFI